ncbi:hypothetical protein FJY71_00645, partial [candidate division WOR-3 bacterium]|nr:hypothetical protein [candidate division WOR-3 bacterium]
MRMPLVLFSVLAVAGLATAGRPDFAEPGAMRESLEHIPRKRWAWWLEDHGHDASRFTRYQRPDSQGLRMVGKWGRGPAVEVTGRDTLVVLTLGSEVALLSFSDPDQPRVLSEIQLNYLPRQSQLVESFLFTGGNGIQIWDVADPTRPVQRGNIPYAVGDFSVQDTLAYFVSLDTFFVYGVADPANPRRVGFYRDSGYVATTNATTAVLLYRDFMGFVDISDPANPHRVGTFPGWAVSAQARGNLCCAAFSDINNQERAWFLTLDISDPASPRQLGRVDSVCGYDLFLADSLAFASGRYDVYEEMRIVSIADSTRPRRLGTCGVWNDNWGVWADLAQRRALIASEPSGLALVDITNLSAPHVDTCIMTANLAVDIWLDGARAYVADFAAGLRVLDVSDPTTPRELGGIDSVWTDCETVVAADSFAFVSWPQPPLFRTVLVSDPAHPAFVGGLNPETNPKDMVLRDTLLYLAGRLRFKVINVARPRSPVLVGSCNAGDLNEAGLCLRDTLAYFVGPFSGLQVFSIADPTGPRLITTLGGLRAWGCDVVDTLLYVGGFDNYLRIWSVADLAHAYELGSAPVPGSGADVKVRGRYAYVATADLAVVDVLNPRAPVFVGTTEMPYEVWAIEFDSTHVYAACSGGGVAILDTFSQGVAEATPLDLRGDDVRLKASVVRDEVVIEFARQSARETCVKVFDATGRVVVELRPPADAAPGWLPVGLHAAPPGVYLITVSREGMPRR